MALDAIAIRALTNELQCLVGGKIDKIGQPEKDEIVLHVRAPGEHYKLVISAGTAHPRIHLTEHAKRNPVTAPMFCMLLRKHLGSGKITSVEQLGFERIVRITIESYNELGDLAKKCLICEIMGRHSNIILTESDGRILDSIKRVDESISSVRKILPGEPYSPPPEQDKVDLIDFTENDTPDFTAHRAADRAIMDAVAGISPLTAREVAYSVTGVSDSRDVDPSSAAGITDALVRLAHCVREGAFEPCLIIDSDTNKPLEFSAIRIGQYGSLANVVPYPNMNSLTDDFYLKRDMHERLRRKSSDLVKLLNNNIERLSKKMSILERTIKDAQNLDKFKMRGDLITANIYRISAGDEELVTENYMVSGSPIVKIPLDASLSPAQNAQRYYKKYTKSKTALTEAAKQMEISRADLTYMESTLTMAENAETEDDINAIRAELTEQGYIQPKRNSRNRRQKIKSKPLHFISSDGFDIYVGRNNTQNDYLTLKFANSSDLWFHTKGIHGSHTVIKFGADKDAPRETILEAAQLAAYYSKARASSQVPVDYTIIKNVKKPNGAKPGMVIYDSYNTIYVTPRTPDDA